MLMWFSSYKDENDNMLFIDMFEIHSSGNTHLVLSVSDFKSTAEFDQIHRMYEGIVEMKKNISINKSISWKDLYSPKY